VWRHLDSDSVSQVVLVIRPPKGQHSFAPVKMAVGVETSLF